MQRSRVRLPSAPLFSKSRRILELGYLSASDSAAFKRTRETQLPVDNRQQPRVLAIVGGKLTGYRATAEKAMHMLRHSLPARRSRANTATLPLKPVT